MRSKFLFWTAEPQLTKGHPGFHLTNVSLTNPNRRPSMRLTGQFWWSSGCKSQWGREEERQNILKFKKELCCKRGTEMR